MKKNAKFWLLATGYGLLIIILAGCSMGEPVMPNPPPGLALSRTVGLVAPVPSPILHTLEDRDQCFDCHAIGAVEAPPAPEDADHEAGQEEFCTTCHAVWLIPAITSTAAPAIPHDVEGYECLVCHKLGVANAPRTPENHNGLASDLCLACHIPASQVEGGESIGAPPIEAPLNPHVGQKGYSDCLRCHERGAPGTPRFPPDHKGRTNDVCGTCHRAPTSEPPPPLDSVLALIEAGNTGDTARGQSVYAKTCAPCHGDNGEGADIAPTPINDAALLSGLTDEELATTVRLGRVGPENTMDPLPDLSDQDILDVIAFLRTW